MCTKDGQQLITTDAMSHRFEDVLTGAEAANKCHCNCVMDLNRVKSCIECTPAKKRTAPVYRNFYKRSSHHPDASVYNKWNEFI